MTDLATIETEAAAFESAVADRVAPATGGVLSRLGSIGSLAGSLSIPGVAQVQWAQVAWSIATSRFTAYVLIVLLAASVAGYEHHRGYYEAADVYEKREAAEDEARRSAAAAKAAADQAVVAAAVDQANAASSSDRAEIARLQARIAKVPVTRTCPPILLDTIRGLGGRR